MSTMYSNVLVADMSHLTCTLEVQCMTCNYSAGMVCVCDKPTQGLHHQKTLDRMAKRGTALAKPT